MYHPATATQEQFQSTPSVGRATYRQCQRRFCRYISIHALRGEGDCGCVPPMWLVAEFQSTPSVGRTTRITRLKKPAERISIHALRGEDDSAPRIPRLSEQHFNPRPPWGGRPKSNRHMSVKETFQSTPSVGRTTCPCAPALLLGQISIHALRGEDDDRATTGTRTEREFQSTPSVGRTTEADHDKHRKKSHFNPRPSWGGRPWLL